MALFWFVFFLGLLLIEISTVNLVSIWFAVGALVSCIVSLFVDSLYVQVFGFILTSIITLLITKPFVKKVRKRKIQPTNLDRIVGNIGFVTEEIAPHEKGEIKVDGKRWTAVSDKKILVGTKVKILKIDGVKAVVEKCKED